MFFVPGLLRGALLEFVNSIVADGRSGFSGWVDHYVLNPNDLLGRGPLIHDPAVTAMYAATASVATALLSGLLVYASLRSMWERSFRAKYTLKVMLPRLMLVLFLLPAGLYLINGAVALNGAVSHAVWTAGPGHDVSCLGRMTGGPQSDGLWCAFMTQSIGENLVLALLIMLLAVLLIVLAFVGVVRGVMIAILAVCAPLAFLCLALPETRGYALAWRRLLFAAVFSQAIQVLVLRLALMITFRDSVISVIHGLVAMYIVLKVPSALHAASSAESKLMMHARHLEHTVQTAMQHAVSPPATRVRAHPAA